MEKWKALALLACLAFYGIYLGKAFLLKKRHINANRLGRGEKPLRVRYVEIVGLVLTFTMPLIQLCSIFVWPPLSLLQFPLLGMLVAFAGVALFAGAVWTMRDNWRAGIDATQNTSLVQEGLYRFSRNPAFLGFDLFYLGIFLAFPTALLGIFCLLATGFFHAQILAEEAYLKETFGEAYSRYAKKTGRYCPLL